MFVPQGFSQQSIQTHLGYIVYYTNNRPPWNITSGDRKSLVFLHGLGGGSSAYEWSKVYPAFADRYQILAPDLLGWGRSAHPQRNYRPEDYITTIEKFIEYTCNEPVTVIASALTAAFTIRAAIARPELFKSLILTTAAGLNEFSKYQENFFTQLAGTPIIDRLLYSTGVATSFGIRNFLEQRQFAKKERISDELVEAYLQSAQQHNAEYAALSFVRGDLCFDLTQYIEGLTTPTAMIWGRASEYTGPDVGYLLQKMNSNAIRIVYQLSDVGFTPQLELPGVMVGLIQKFLPELESNPTEASSQI